MIKENDGRNGQAPREIRSSALTAGRIDPGALSFAIARDRFYHNISKSDAKGLHGEPLGFAAENAPYLAT
jgi:hypothetical protein